MYLHKPIKGIFFDVGWTMNYPASGHWMITKKAYEYIDINIVNSLPKERISKAYEKCMDYLNKNHLLKTEEDEYEQFKIFYTMFSNLLPELKILNKQIEEIAYDKVYNTNNYVFFDDTKTTIDVLSKKYKLGIISDTWPSIERILKSAGLLDYFASKTYSYNLGVYKPNPKMYDHALSILKVPAEETIFIDDSVENLKGAMNFGIQPVLINAKNDEDININIIKIKKLSDLLEFL